jgi:FMN phosphatase YigB (HAD superfamily)
MKIIFDYNRTIFNPNTNKLYRGALELLIILSKKHELYLVSRNQPNRLTEIENLKIKDYFNKVMFVENKSIQLFNSIAGKSKNIIIVGDSIQDEIRIGNKLNFITIRILKGKFSKTVPQRKIEQADFEIINLNEILNIIKRYEE